MYMALVITAILAIYVMFWVETQGLLNEYSLLRLTKHTRETHNQLK